MELPDTEETLRRGRKPIPEEDKKTIGMSIVLDEETKLELDTVAERLDRKPAALVRVIVKEWLRDNRQASGEVV